MSESTSTSTTTNAPPPALSAGRVLKIVVPIALVLLAVYWWYSRGESQARSDLVSMAIGNIFASEPEIAGSMAFADGDNDMVADPPSDPAKLINPVALVFSYVASEERGQPEETWTELAAALKEKTGKEVKVAHYDAPEDQLAALKKGELHILGLNTGLVQNAVEQDGFVPLCTMGRDDGTFGYTMEFLVPAGRPHCNQRVPDRSGRQRYPGRHDRNERSRSGGFCVDLQVPAIPTSHTWLRL